MKHLLRRIGYLLLALFSCLSFTASAQEQYAQLVPATPSVATEKATPALWKVSDGDTTIYLFGTIHALPPGIDWFGGPVREAFEGSQELVTEITPTDPIEMQRLGKPGKIFVAVGAGHLAGPGSLQEQLAAQGIATQRVQ